MSPVSIKSATQRTRKPRSLSVEPFQLLLTQFEGDLYFRTMMLLALGFGLGISELLGLKWCDVKKTEIAFGHTTPTRKQEHCSRCSPPAGFT
jgi:integrase